MTAEPHNDLSRNASIAAHAMDNIEIDFTHLPGYARYLLDNKLEEYAVQQLRITRELKIPLLRFFESLTDEEMMVIGRRTSEQLLSAMAQNQGKQFIMASVSRWLNDQLDEIARNEVVVEDILLISLLRKRTLRHFLSAYTKEIDTCLLLTEEIDTFMHDINTASFKTLIKIQQDLFEKAQVMAQIGNWSWDIKTDKRTWSDELFKTYQIEKDFYAPADLHDFNHPDDNEMVQQKLQHSIDTLQPHDFYYRIILKNGTEKTLHSIGEIKVDEAGKASKAFGTLQDVTVQKLNERELNEKENFIRKITDITPSIIIAYNIHTDKFLFVNKGLEKQLGYTQEDIGENGIGFFTSRIHTDDLQSLADKYARTLEAFAPGAPELNDNEAVEFKYRILHKSGKYRWFHTFGTIFNRNRENEVEEIVTVSIDITDEVNAIVELIKKNDDIRKSEERYHRMIDEVEDYAIILLNKDGIIENWNKGAEKIKGYSSDEIMGKSFTVFYTEDDKKRNLPAQLLERAIKEGRATNEGWRVRKNETIFWASVAITSLHDKRNNIIGFSKVTRDLTERKLAEDKMREYTENIELKNKRLEQINKELESFSYMASHDLQEPLRKIQAFSSRLMQKEYANLSDWGKDIFERIQSSANRMQNLIEALLNFSQINSTPEAFELTDTNIILKEVCANLNEIIEEKKAVIEPDQLPTMEVIPFYFQQLLTNMISNALKYSKPDITPEIKIKVTTISATTLPQAEAALYPAYYCISVIDNGIGFDQQYADKIFELFQRLHGKSEYPGTGIGLAICKKIIQLHDGFITAESMQGVGSTFNLFFPIKK